MSLIELLTKERETLVLRRTYWLMDCDPSHPAKMHNQIFNRCLRKIANNYEQLNEFTICTKQKWIYIPFQRNCIKIVFKTEYSSLVS